MKGEYFRAVTGASVTPCSEPETQAEVFTENLLIRRKRIAIIWTGFTRRKTVLRRVCFVIFLEGEEHGRLTKVYENVLDINTELVMPQVLPE